MLTTNLGDLTEDVLLRILALCDINSVISMSLVNRYVRTVARVKQLWVSLVENLIQLSLLELPPGFVATNHSAAELIDHVKRVVQGPRSWRPTTKFVLPVNVRKSQGYQGDSKVKLVNGGRFVVVSHRAGVEIWDVETKRQLWSRPVFAHTFSVDPRDSGTTITLAMTLSDRFTLQVVQIDKVFGEIQEFTQLLPRPYAHAAPIICGSLLIAHMRLNALGGYETIIIDWPTRRYILLDGFRGSSVFPTPVAVRRVNTDIPRRSLGSTSFPDDTSS
ncbi:hypothetical protein B0H14DRAFT_2916693 [Mycena olivaceomarginata]|nr:hypothetical protein B0H14DRAFT_2916693 [Mycena olivaceomarginata]